MLAGIKIVGAVSFYLGVAGATMLSLVERACGSFVTAFVHGSLHGDGKTTVFIRSPRDELSSESKFTLPVMDSRLRSTGCYFDRKGRVNCLLRVPLFRSLSSVVVLGEDEGLFAEISISSVLNCSGCVARCWPMF